MSAATRISIDSAGNAGRLDKFWRSTGFSPAELLLEPEMQQTLDYVSAVPNGGIEFLRVHYMLDLVSAARLGVYDWTKLDRALDVIIERRMRPFFELMGNPSYLYTDLSDRDQAHHWRDFMVQLAERCRTRYGADEVRRWYFETWNEPDIWWKLGGDAGFLNYYDACSEALKAVDPNLIFGGPGVARRLPPIFKTLLAHCDTGTNFFTGETGVRIDFISVHEKGAPKHAEDLKPNSLGIIRHEMMAVDYVRQHHPRFASLPFINNECDPQIGWWLHHTWHGMPYFAALAAKIIDQHQRLMIDKEGVNYAILSNDNGFLGRWGQRTHMAFFGERSFDPAQAAHVTDLKALDDRLAVPRGFDFVKKPALAVMELLAQLGTTRLPVSGDALDPDKDGLGVMATASADGAAVLLYNSVDRLWNSGVSPVTLDFEGMKAGTHAITNIRIEDGKGDPYSVWEALGVLDNPTATQLAAMRAAQEPAISIEMVHLAVPGHLTYQLDLARPGVALVVVSHRDAPEPEAPTELVLRHYPGIHGANAVLNWQPTPYAGLQLFDVLWSATIDAPGEVINPAPLLSGVFLYPVGPIPGYYRVRARDAFGRTSAPSEAAAAQPAMPKPS